MREYSRVHPSFWTGKTGKEIKKQGQDSRIVAMYVLTCPHSNMIGLYYLPVAYISYETGLTEEGAFKGLRSLEQIKFCYYDTDTEFVWVPEMAHYQIGKTLKPNDKQVKGIINICNGLSNNPFLEKFYDKYRVPFNLNGVRPLQGAS